MKIKTMRSLCKLVWFWTIPASRLPVASSTTESPKDDQLEDQTIHSWLMSDPSITVEALDGKLESKAPDVWQSTDSNRNTLVHAACLNPTISVEVVAVLVDAYPEAMHLKSSPYDLTPIEAAIRTGGSTKDDVTFYLLFKFPSLASVVNPRYGTLLHFALQSTTTPAVAEKILDLNPGAVFVTNRHWNLPLLPAARRMPLETVKLLMNANPGSIRHTQRNGSTQLTAMLLWPHAGTPSCRTVQVVAYLIEQYQLQYPPGLSAVNNRGWSAFTNALQALTPETLDPSEYSSESSESYVAVLRLLVQHDPQALYRKYSGPSTRDIGRTPLHVAVDRDAPLEAIRLLIDVSPLALTMKDAAGMTPLEIGLEKALASETLALLSQRTQELSISLAADSCPFSNTTVVPPTTENQNNNASSLTLAFSGTPISIAKSPVEKSPEPIDTKVESSMGSSGCRKPGQQLGSVPFILLLSGTLLLLGQ